MDYILQADPGGHCCGCAARSGPCDSCAACACYAVVFSGVTIDCPCIDNGDGSSTKFLDGGLFNGQPALPLGVFQSFCCAAPNCFNPCAFWQRATSSVLQVRVQNWFTNNTCTGAPSTDSEQTAGINLMLSSGTYYIRASIGSGGTQWYFFFGTAASLPGTISNALAACGSTTFTDPIAACFSPPTTVQLREGHGGTATITVPASCGACCQGTSCSQVSSAYCTILGGTYRGDGTTCTSSLCSGMSPPP